MVLTRTLPLHTTTCRCKHRARGRSGICQCVSYSAWSTGTIQTLVVNGWLFTASTKKLTRNRDSFTSHALRTMSSKQQTKRRRPMTINPFKSNLTEGTLIQAPRTRIPLVPLNWTAFFHQPVTVERACSTHKADRSCVPLYENGLLPMPLCAIERCGCTRDGLHDVTVEYRVDATGDVWWSYATTDNGLEFSKTPVDSLPAVGIRFLRLCVACRKPDYIQSKLDEATAAMVLSKQHAKRSYALQVMSETGISLDVCGLVFDYQAESTRVRYECPRCVRASRRIETNFSNSTYG